MIKVWDSVSTHKNMTVAQMIAAGHNVSAIFADTTDYQITNAPEPTVNNPTHG